MSRDQQRLMDYLEHILQAVDRIDQYVAGIDRHDFLKNELVQDAVIRNLEVIGEASHNIEVRFPEFAASHPELPLSFAYQMRNAVAHGYFKIDIAIIWNTVERDLPGLRDQVMMALGACRT